MDFRFKSAVLLSVIAAFLVIAQGQSSSSAHPGTQPANAKSVDPGAVTSGVYRNSSFSFSYKLPYGWVERTDQMRGESGDPSKSMVLLSTFERPPQAEGETVNSAVLIAAESVSSYPGLKTAADYFGPLTEVATAKGFKVVNEPYDVQVGAKQLVRSDFSKEVGNVTMYQASLVTLERGYSVSFTFLAASEDEVDQLIEGLSFSSMRRPR